MGKRKGAAIICAIIGGGVIALLVSCCGRQDTSCDREEGRVKYWGRDHRAVFGDGYFGIGHVNGEDWLLSNYNETSRPPVPPIMRGVGDWRVCGETVYVVGADFKQFAIVDLSATNVATFVEYENLPADSTNAFDSLIRKMRRTNAVKKFLIAPAINYCESAA